MTGVVFDFDGVIADTSAHALSAANSILKLIEPTASPFASREEYRSRLNFDSLRGEFGAVAAETLTDLHPLLVCRLVLERPAPLVPGLVDAIVDLGLRPPVITAGYEMAVTASLGERAGAFGRIHGRETAHKDELLRKYCPPGTVMVTDTMTDIERCKALGIHAIAVAWGYDPAESLVAAGALDVAHVPSDLKRLLKQHALS